MKPHIFIASSGDAKAFASELGRQLRSLDKFGQVRVWCEDEFNTPGLSITQQLVVHARQCEFAVAILTPDDTKSKEGKEIRIPRDSVVFETGLFTGALDLSFQRCFILCGVGDAGLPTDLREILHIGFEPGSIAAAADRIVKRVFSPYRVFERPVVPCISREALMFRERLEKWEGNLENENAKVVVSARNPLEKKSDPGFLNATIENIGQGVEYFYIFSKDSPEDIAKFFWLLANTALNKAPVDGPVSDLVDTIARLAQKVWIYVLADRPSFEYCVHNADKDYAKCYLRYKTPDGEWLFAVMSANSDAVASDLFSRKERNARLDPFVFRAFRGFNGTATFSQLKFRIRELFKNVSTDEDFLKKIVDICFGSKLAPGTGD